MNNNLNNPMNSEGNVRVSRSAVIGPNVFLSGNIAIAAHAQLVGNIYLNGRVNIQSYVIIEPNVCVSKFIESDDPKEVTVGEHAFVGAGCTILEGVNIGHHSRIQPGTIVTRDVPPFALVSGSPPSIRGYLDDKYRPDLNAVYSVKGLADLDKFSLSVRGVFLSRMREVRDLRGDLCVGEVGRDVPFLPKRYFMVFDVPSFETRGEHAHIKCEQFLVCPKGSVSILVDDGKQREEVVLNQPNMGLYIPPKIWGVQYKYTTDAILLVLASELYDADDYIRDYDAFIDFVNTK